MSKLIRVTKRNCGEFKNMNEIEFAEDVLKRILEIPLNNPMRFTRIGNNSGYELWGKIDDSGRAMIRKNIVDDFLEENNINPLAFLRWAKKNEYLIYEHGHTTYKARIPGDTGIARCVYFAVRLEP